MDELVEKFSLERVSKAGAKFDFEKAKWFNAEWIKKLNAESLKEKVKAVLEDKGVLVADEAYLLKVIEQVKDRCVLLPDFYHQCAYFFEAPKEYDVNSVKPKWTDAKTAFFISLITILGNTETWEAAVLESAFKVLAEEKAIKAGELLLPFRIMLVGGKFGPHVFDIAALLGRDETILRIEKALTVFTS
jgi:glutamyl-tRNA synthetase